jgi:hypothetical protein
MPNFAVIDGINVINTIVAESLAIAEEVTGKTCVEFNDTESAETGGTYVDGVFIPEKPYESWILNENNTWQPPLPYPDHSKNYVWDEPTVSWVEV